MENTRNFVCFRKFNIEYSRWDDSESEFKQDGVIAFYSDNFVSGYVVDRKTGNKKLVVGVLVEGIGMRFSFFDAEGNKFPEMINIGVYEDHYGGELLSVDTIGAHPIGPIDAYVRDVENVDYEQFFSTTNQLINDVLNKDVKYDKELLKLNLNVDTKKVVEMLYKCEENSNKPDRNRLIMSYISLMLKSIGVLDYGTKISHAVEEYVNKKNGQVNEAELNLVILNAMREGIFKGNKNFSEAQLREIIPSIIKSVIEAVDESLVDPSPDRQ